MGISSSILAYNIVACSIFAIVAFTFLFPCNALIPLDRRTIAVFGSGLCYITRTFIFRGDSIVMLEAVDFDVLILLASIMCINHLVVHLPETKKIIKHMQDQVQSSPLKGFWLISAAAFFISPFLTNDGVCLLFVELILDAFEATKALSHKCDGELPSKSNGMQLETGDAIYFLLTLACSANIGSSLTYTGNPQNMLIFEDAGPVLPPLKFLAIMLLPSLASWLLTTYWIQRCWLYSKASIHHNGKVLDDEEYKQVTIGETEDPESNGLNAEKPVLIESQEIMIMSSLDVSKPTSPKSPNRAMAAMSPRRRRTLERENMVQKVRHVISSPFPYMILILLAVMIVMIFVNVLPIAALTCISAIVMVVALVIGNHWKGQHVWGEVGDHEDELYEEQFNHSDLENKFQSEKALVPQVEKLPPMTKEEKVDNINEFFEDLFKSIDYNILIIFMGLFIVVANVDSTGIPKQIWKGIVGNVPFRTVGSVVGISIFILTVSQLLGNVAVVQLAIPNVEVLEDSAKAYAWSVISFVATVGGNLTITGSAANIIVAEKVARLDPNSSLDFFCHYKVCFWITLVSCAMGALIITGEFCIDKLILGY